MALRNNGFFFARVVYSPEALVLKKIGRFVVVVFLNSSEKIALKEQKEKVTGPAVSVERGIWDRLLPVGRASTFLGSFNCSVFRMIHLASSECAAFVLLLALVIAEVLQPLFSVTHFLGGCVAMRLMASGWLCEAALRAMDGENDTRQSKSNSDLNVLIVGCSRGSIGFSVLCELLQKYSLNTVIATFRTPAEGVAMRETLLRCGIRMQSFQLEPLRYEDRTSVEHFLRKLNNCKLDVVVHCAALMDVTGAGFCSMLNVNALMPHEILFTLLRHLPRTSEWNPNFPRIVVIASCAHILPRYHHPHSTPLQLLKMWCDSKQTEALSFEFITRYGLTKLCNIYTALTLSKRDIGNSVWTQSTNVDVVVCHPGLVASNLFRSLIGKDTLFAAVLKGLSLLMFRTTKESAAMIVKRCIFAPRRMHGTYVVDGLPQSRLLSTWALDSAMRRAAVTWMEDAMRKEGISIADNKRTGSSSDCPFF